MKLKSSYLIALSNVFFLILTVSSTWSTQVYDYDSGNYLSLVRHQDNDASSYAFNRDKNLVRAGCYSGRFELRPGDHWTNDGDNQERSELSEDDYKLPENTTAFYGFSLLIPASQLSDCKSAEDCWEWRSLMQWHSWPADGDDWRHPLLTLSLDNGQLSFILAKPNGSKWYTKLTSVAVEGDTWIDFVVEFKWSRQANRGVVRIWENGQLIVNRQNEQVGYSDQDSKGVFWKHGLYRQAVQDTDILFFDELRRGSSYNDVAPRDRACHPLQVIPAISNMLLRSNTRLGGIENEVIVGDYGADYNGDWATLATGKELADKTIPESQFTQIIGDENKVSVSGRDYVKISDKTWKVNWKNTSDIKYNNALFHVSDCRKVVFENINIIQADHDYRASSTIFVEDCEEVVIRNVFIAGTTPKAHIRVEGCERVLIEYVEISGYNYGVYGIRGGEGIKVENSPLYTYSPNPREHSWTRIQHCYIHDYLDTDTHRNQDGIHINAAGNGLLFNCVFENWGIEGLVADAAVDVSHRRYDNGYANRFFRIERNIFDNVMTAKSSSENDQPTEQDNQFTTNFSNKLFWANNIYHNTNIHDYHKGGEVYHIHETYSFDNSHRESSRVHMIFRLTGGDIISRNCLTYSTKDDHWAENYISSAGNGDEWKFLDTDYFTYIIKDAGHHWLRINDSLGGGQINEWTTWQNGNGSWLTGLRDQHSQYSPWSASKSYFQNASDLDFRLTGDNPAAYAGTGAYRNHSDPRMLVNRDFLGKTRPVTPSIGAFEVY